MDTVDEMEIREGMTRLDREKKKRNERFFEESSILIDERKVGNSRRTIKNVLMPFDH